MATEILTIPELPIGETPVKRGDTNSVVDGLVMDLSKSALDLNSHGSTYQEKIDAGSDLSALTAVMQLRTERTLQQGLEDEDPNSENEAERHVEGELTELARQVVLGVLSGQSDSKSGKSIEALRSSRQKRILGSIATTASIGLFTYAGYKGLEHSLSGIGLGASGVIATVRSGGLASIRAALGVGSKELNSTIKDRVNKIEVERLDEITAEASYLPEEEASEYIQGMIAAELVKPLAEDLSLIAHSSDLSAEEGEEYHATPAELASELTEATGDFLSKLYGIPYGESEESDGRKKRYLSVASNIAISTAKKLPGIKGAVFKPA